MNVPQCYVIRILPVLFNKRSGPTLELSKLQVSCQNYEKNWTLVTGPTVFYIAVIWNNITSYEVTYHLARNMLERRAGKYNKCNTILIHERCQDFGVFLLL
jgi:hypothetical protein